MSKGCRLDWDDFTFLPDRVRHHEIQQSAFFGRILLFEQLVHVSREFEQADSRFDILPISSSTRVDFSQNPGLSFAAFRRLPLEQGNVDSAVQPVFVRRVEPDLNARLFLLELRDCLIPENAPRLDGWPAALWRSSSRCPRQSRSSAARRRRPAPTFPAERTVRALQFRILTFRLYILD
jgi:hypothetical protein